MIRRDGERLLIEGPLTFGTASTLLEAAARETRDGASIVDFAGVTTTDSAALALALELRRQAEADRRTIGFSNVPAAVRKLADLYSVGTVVFGE